jgi:hypothetical protein
MNHSLLRHQVRQAKGGAEAPSLHASCCAPCKLAWGVREKLGGVAFVGQKTGEGVYCEACAASLGLCVHDVRGAVGLDQEATVAETAHNSGDRAVVQGDGETVGRRTGDGERVRCALEDKRALKLGERERGRRELALGEVANELRGRRPSVTTRTRS